MSNLPGDMEAKTVTYSFLEDAIERTLNESGSMPLKIVSVDEMRKLEGKHE